MSKELKKTVAINDHRNDNDVRSEMMRVIPQHVLSCLVLYAPLAGRTLPAGEGGCAAGWLPPSHYLNNGPAVCSAVQIVTRVPLSLYLGPRLVNVVSLAYKILTANHVLIMQPRGRTTDECSIRVPQMSGRQF